MARLGKLPWLILSLVILVLDLWSKDIVVNALEYRERITVIPGFFDWVHVYNTGAAFSFLADASGWQRWFFAVVAVGVSVVLTVWLKRLKNHEGMLAVALALILGGALGNLHDRVLLGHVVDFILLHWHDQYYFPAFNIADTAITLGAMLLLVDMFKSKKTKEESHD